MINHFYRKRHVGNQMHANENPNNFYDSQQMMWTTDTRYGLSEMPKRPWEMLKDPAKASAKLRRSSDAPPATEHPFRK